jgi:hypothetical protein
MSVFDDDMNRWQVSKVKNTTSLSLHFTPLVSQVLECRASSRRSEIPSFSKMLCK